VVPWTADYKFDAAVFRRQSRTIARHLTRHIYIFGMAGEGFTPMLGIVSLFLPTIVERIAWGRSLSFRYRPGER